MLIISVKINIKDYPSNSFTSGVHISFHTQGSKADSGSGLIASTGQVTLIRLKKTINEYLNNTTIESFDGKISTIGDYNFEENWGNKNDTVVLAMTYQDLNVMIVKELPPYDVLTFLSETGGVLGLLLGTSLVNLIVFLIQWAWGLKFNETNWANVQNKKEEELNINNFDINNMTRVNGTGFGFGLGSLVSNDFANFGLLHYCEKMKNKENNNYDKGLFNNSNNKECNEKKLNDDQNQKEKHMNLNQNAYKLDDRRENDYFNSNGDLVNKNEDELIYEKISII